MTPTLEAPGIMLRPLEITDAEALFAAHGDEATHRYWAGPAHKDVAETRAYIEAVHARPTTQGWAITESGGPALGRVALYELHEGVGELGIILRPDAHGRGWAAKAIALVTAYAFDQSGMHRLIADVDPDNAPSLSLFLRAGFQREAVLRHYWKTHLGLRDSVILAKLKRPDAQ